MFFKRTGIYSITAVIAVASLSGCGEFLSGHPSKEKVIEMSDERLQCLSSLQGVIRDFSAGNAKEPAIRSSVQCLREAFTYFRQFTKGADSEAYSDKELHAFFSKYFVKDQSLSPELVRALMMLKKGLV